MDTRWYYQAPDGSTGGPLPTAEVLKALLEGQLPDNVQLCEEGRGSWAPPKNLPAFKLASRVVRAARSGPEPAAPAPQPQAPALSASQSLPRAPLPPPRVPMPPPRAPMPPPRAMPMPPPAAAAPAGAPEPEDDDDDEMRTIVVTSSTGAAMRGASAPGPMPVATVPGLPAPAPVPARVMAPPSVPQARPVPPPVPQARPMGPPPVPQSRPMAPPPAAQPPATPGFGQLEEDDDDEELKTRVATSPETDPDLPYSFGGMPSPIGPDPVAPPARAPAPAPAAPPRRVPVQTLMGMPSPAAPAPVRPPPAPVPDEDDSEDMKTRVASPDDAPMVFRPPVPVSPVPHEGHQEERLQNAAPKVVVSERPEPPPASSGPSFDGGLDTASQRNWPAPKLIPPPPKKVTIDDGSGTDPGARITDPGSHTTDQGARITSPAMRAVDPRQRQTVRLQAMQPTMKLQPIKPPGPSKLVLLLIAGGAALLAFLFALVIVVLMKR